MVFFYRGKRPGWQGLEQFKAAAAVREEDSGRHAGKIPGAKSGAQADGTDSGKSSPD